MPNIIVKRYAKNAKTYTITYAYLFSRMRIAGLHSFQDCLDTLSELSLQEEFSKSDPMTIAISDEPPIVTMTINSRGEFVIADSDYVIKDARLGREIKKNGHTDNGRVPTHQSAKPRVNSPSHEVQGKHDK
jgi:hypothetical protein